MLKWKKVKLSELGEIIGGATPSTKREEYYNGDIAWLTPKDLSGYSSRYVSKGERSVTKEGLDSCSAKILPKDSVLFTSRAPIGYVAIAENEICTNQGFKSIVPNKNTDPLFLFYLLKYNKDRIEAMGSGTTFKEVSGSVMKSIEVDVPEYEEQKRISAILTSIDNLIEQNNHMNKNLEAQTQAIFKSWFVDFEPWGGVMPKDWREGPLAEICDVKGGKRLPKGENLISTPNAHPYIRVRDMSNTIFAQMSDAIEYASDEVQRSIARYIVSAGDVIISIVGTIGLVCKVHSSLDMANLTENCVKLTNFNGVTPDFLYFFLTSLAGQEAMKQGTVGAVQAKLPIKNIQAIIILQPSSEIMFAFDKVTNPIMGVIASNYTQSSKLTYLRDTLLPKLMCGEIDVKEEE